MYTTIMGLWLAEADYLTKMILGWIIATLNLLKVRLVFCFLFSFIIWLLFKVIHLKYKKTPRSVFENVVYLHK